MISACVFKTFAGFLNAAVGCGESLTLAMFAWINLTFGTNTLTVIFNSEIFAINNKPNQENIYFDFISWS